MILRGRLSIYGEYLMPLGTRGLMVPSPFLMATNEHDHIPLHPQYSHDRDSVARALQQKRIATRDHFRGDLPLGCGYAGSTVLALLHLQDNTGGDELQDLVHQCDQAIHGFTPSGVDVTSCIRQTPGFYWNREWETADLRTLQFSLLHFPKEGLRTLPEIQARMLDRPEPLSAIAATLTGGLIETGTLEYEPLLEYARLLLRRGVYSKPAESFIAHLTSEGFVAKGIGGLYDKAVLVVWPDGDAESLRLREIIAASAPAVAFDGSWPYESHRA